MIQMVLYFAALGRALECLFLSLALFVYIDSYIYIYI